VKVPPEERFRAVAADYARYRPGYPDAIVDRILGIAGLLPPGPGALVVDVGCGTGISARAFAARGVRVVGVDPNAAMLAEARSGAGGPEYREGEAVATGLPAGCADLVVCAQAFHWFDRDAAMAEFRRILRPGDRVAVFWNFRVPGTPFADAYDAVLREFCAEAAPADDRTVAVLRGLREFAGIRDREDLRHERVERLDRETCFGRVRSDSCVAHGVADRAGFEAALGRAFDGHARDGLVPWTLRVEGSVFRIA
jgi:SAM-dependent methyltransferase